MQTEYNLSSFLFSITVRVAQWLRRLTTTSRGSLPGPSGDRGFDHHHGLVLLFFWLLSVLLCIFRGEGVLTTQTSMHAKDGDPCPQHGPTGTPRRNQALEAGVSRSAKSEWTGAVYRIRHACAGSIGDLSLSLAHCHLSLSLSFISLVCCTRRTLQQLHSVSIADDSLTAVPLCCPGDA